MIEKANIAESAAGRKRGLRFIDSERVRASEDADVHAKLYDSRAGLAAYFRYRPRQVEKMRWEFCHGVTKIHESVLHRLERATDAYAPTVIPADFEVATTLANQWSSAAEVTRLLSEQSGIRSAVQGEIEAKITTRSRLYTAFMGITVIVAGLAAYFRVSPSIDSLPEFAGFFPALNEAVRNPGADASLLLKIPSWIYNAIPGLLNGFIPASWESVVDGLFDRVDITLGISALLAGLLVWRQKVKDAMKQMSLKAWQAVFDAAQAKAESRDL